MSHPISTKASPKHDTHPFPASTQQPQLKKACIRLVDPDVDSFPNMVSKMNVDHIRDAIGQWQKETLTEAISAMSPYQLQVVGSAISKSQLESTIASLAIPVLHKLFDALPVSKIRLAYQALSTSQKDLIGKELEGKQAEALAKTPLSCAHLIVGMNIPNIRKAIIEIAGRLLTHQLNVVIESADGVQFTAMVGKMTPKQALETIPTMCPWQVQVIYSKWNVDQLQPLLPITPPSHLSDALTALTATKLDKVSLLLLKMTIPQLMKIKKSFVEDIEGLTDDQLSEGLMKWMPWQLRVAYVSLDPARVTRLLTVAMTRMDTPTFIDLLSVLPASQIRDIMPRLSEKHRECYLARFFMINEEHFFVMAKELTAADLILGISDPDLKAFFMKSVHLFTDEQIGWIVPHLSASEIMSLLEVFQGNEEKEKAIFDSLLPQHQLEMHALLPHRQKQVENQLVKLQAGSTELAVALSAIVEGISKLAESVKTWSALKEQTKKGLENQYNSMRTQLMASQNQLHNSHRALQQMKNQACAHVKLAESIRNKEMYAKLKCNLDEINLLGQTHRDMISRVSLNQLSSPPSLQEQLQKLSRIILNAPMEPVVGISEKDSFYKRRAFAIYNGAKEALESLPGGKETDAFDLDDLIRAQIISVDALLKQRITKLSELQAFLKRTLVRT